MTKSTNEWLENCMKEVRTLNDVFPFGAKQSVDKNCLASFDPDDRGSLRWITYETALKRIKYFADGLLLTLTGCTDDDVDGVKAPVMAPGVKVGFYAKTSAEYTLAEYACFRHSIISVPIYDAFRIDFCAKICGQVELVTLICDTIDRAQVIMQNIDKFPALKNLIIFRATEETIHRTFRAADQNCNKSLPRIYSMSQIEMRGQRHPQPDHPPNRDDLALILYTSGTTGFPKGAMIRHRNLVACFVATVERLGAKRLSHDDVMIAYLPMGHIYERIVEFQMLVGGGKIGYASGDIKRLSTEIALIRPTLFPCVPRVLYKIYDTIWTEAAKGGRWRSWALQFGYLCAQTEIPLATRLFERLIFDKIAEKFGGKIRLISSGSAPFDENVAQFLRVAMKCDVINGYGQTECGGLCNLNSIEEQNVSNVGRPLICCSIRLIDVPEMNYRIADRRGEVAIRGESVFAGYYQDKRKTNEVFTEDGWLLTGDIGEWNEDGTLRIIDRKSEIFKLSQGEFIWPNMLETIYARSAYVTQIFVYGDPYRSYLIAIVVPNIDKINDYLSGAQQVVSPSGTTNSISARLPAKQNSKSLDNIIERLLLDDMFEIGKRENLTSLQLIKAIIVHRDEFTIENGLLTPTSKNKRSALVKMFKSKIDQLYDRNKL